MKTTFEIDKNLEIKTQNKTSAEVRFYSILKMAPKTYDVLTRDRLFNKAEVVQITKFSFKTVHDDMITGRLEWLERGKTKYVTHYVLAKYMGIPIKLN